jgi:hypothetical protein
LLALAGLGVTMQSAPAAQTGPSRCRDGLLLLLGMSRADLDEPAGAAPIFAGRSVSPAGWLRTR